MKTLLFGFACLSLGMIIMGATVFDVQENIIGILGLWGAKKILDIILIEPAAKELGIPTKDVIKTIASNWLRERDSIRHYLDQHAGVSKSCPQCQTTQ